MNSTLIQLGAALRQARSERGLTQAALAERAGIPRLKVIQVEAGDERVASRYYAFVVAALGQRLNLQPARRPTLDELQRENMS
jgi:transcriptional regulator with XRE-family HTH domain